jgi:nucleoside-diphosphate-sugar epimerase
MMEIGANYLLYQLLLGEKGGPFPLQAAPYYCDVRDVAEAHVRVLEVPPAPKDVQSKRFLMCSGQFLHQDVVRLLQEKRPALKDRLPALEKALPAPGPFSTTDTSRIVQILKMQEPIAPWETTVLETLDALTKAEKEQA